MTAKSFKKKGSAPSPGQRVISENRKARHNYTVLDSLECGLVLVGSEVKSLREGKVSLEEAYARVKDDEVLAGRLRYSRIHRRQPLQSSAQATAEAALAPPRGEALRPSGV